MSKTLLADHQLVAVARFLKAKTDEMPAYWRRLGWIDRKENVEYMLSCGLIEPSYPRVKVFIRPPHTSAPLHEPPNGGQRRLPLQYNELTTQWLRANGHFEDPCNMDVDHLRNCLNLLKESHQNHMAGATAVLGKIEMYFGSRPSIAQAAANLCHEIMTVDVEEMYPIWTVLSNELAGRMRAAERDRVRELREQIAAAQAQLDDLGY